MSDRELLELAAKAAGYPTNHPWNAERLLLEPPVIGLCIMGIRTNWNPLTDDGDALRLAVKLRMNFYTGYKKVSAEILSDSDEPSIFITMCQSDGDVLAATRRAIVRAAAEIGKSL